MAKERSVAPILQEATIISRALGLLAGSAAAAQLPHLPDPRWALLLAPAAWLAAGGGGLARAALWCLTGAAWFVLRAHWVLASGLPVALEGRDLWVTGTVAGIPRADARGVRFNLDVEGLQTAAGAPVAGFPKRVRLFYFHPPRAVRAGERWRLQVRLKRPHGFYNPGGFDYEAWLFRARVRATGYVRPAADNRRLAPGRGVDTLRGRLVAGIHALIRDHASAGLVAALATGERSGITPAQWAAAAATGTSHLLAISGLHVGLAAGWVFLLIRWAWNLAGAWRWLAAPRAAAVAALVAAAAYALLAGFAVPTQRALVMLALWLGAVAANRPLEPARGLALAAVAVVLFDPLSVLSAGFWLSFAAVGAILSALGTGSAPRWRRWWRLQWTVAMGLAPILLLWFGRISLVAPLANLVAVPVAGVLVVPAVLAGTACLAAGAQAAAGPLLQGAAWVLDLLWRGLDWAAASGVAQWQRPAPPLPLVGAALAGLVLGWRGAGLPGRRAALAWCLPLALWQPPRPPAGQFWFTLLDVGQGLAAVVRTRHHTLVFDTGARFSARFDAGSAVVVPYLRQAGVGRVDTLVVSHGDNDHIGGASSLRAALPVDRILSSVPARLPGAGACRTGQSWRWDGVRFRILNPPPGAAGGGNDASCVLRVSAGPAAVLLPGDIEAAAEYRLDPEGLAAGVLVAPHHGSRTSSTVAFVRAVGAQRVLYPAGRGNRYGHPHPQVVARYRAEGARGFVSGCHGALEVRFAGGRPRVRAWRAARPRLWHDPRPCLAAGRPPVRVSPRPKNPSR